MSAAEKDIAAWLRQGAQSNFAVDPVSERLPAYLVQCGREISSNAASP